MSADLMIREDLTTSNLLLAAEEQKGDVGTVLLGFFKKKLISAYLNMPVSVRAARVRLRRALFDLRL